MSSRPVTSAAGLALPADSVPRLFARLEAGANAGLHSAAQVYVSRAGQPIADFGLGFARANVPLSPDSLTLWLSSCKPITAVALALAWEDGLLELDDPVAVHLPGFERAGKSAVTLRHLLTHTAGLRHVKIDIVSMGWDGIVEAVSASPMEPGWIPGRRAGYHMGSTWFVLAEVVRRLTGRPYGEHLRRAIYEPLGMQGSWMGMPPDLFGAYRDRLTEMFDTSPKGAGARHPWTEPERVARCAPSGNGWGPVRELGFFYEMLLGRGERAGVRLLSSQAVEALTAPHRVGMTDETFRHAMDWGLGFIVNTLSAAKHTQPYGFGSHASPRAYGHGGYQSSIAMADPEHGLVVALVTNGTPGEMRHAQRIRELVTDLYEDLGLAVTGAS